VQQLHSFVCQSLEGYAVYLWQLMAEGCVLSEVVFCLK